MLTDIERAEKRVKLLESDLKDTQDPKVLARWPNLGEPGLVGQTEERLAEAKSELARLREAS